MRTERNGWGRAVVDTIVRTYTPADLATLTLPGDLPGLVDGWCGPVEIEVREGWLLFGSTSTQRGPRRLPLARWEARARVAAWLEEGERCPHDAERWHQRANMSGHEWDVCSRCGAHLSGPARDSEGYLRAPVPRAREWLDWPDGIEPWLSAAMLHASAMRAVAGMGLLDVGWIVCDAYDAFFVPLEGEQFHFCGLRKGQQAGASGRAIAAGCALLDGEGDARTLRVEVPRG